jgi:hypothetical protein
MDREAVRTTCDLPSIGLGCTRNRVRQATQNKICYFTSIAPLEFLLQNLPGALPFSDHRQPITPVLVPA